MLRRTLRFFSHNKLTGADDAAHLIRDNTTLVVGGFAGTGAPEAVLEAIGRRFKNEGHPRNLTLLFGVGPGDWDCRGLNHLAHEGLLYRTIGSHYDALPKVAALVSSGKIPGGSWNLPMGAIVRMIRADYKNTPGYITKVGLGTVVDPEVGTGGKLTPTTPDLIKTVEVAGEKYLLFKLPADITGIDAAIVRGTTADTDGNISFEKEALYSNNFIMAQAAASNRGIVIAQVESVADAKSLPLKSVVIPSCYVDCVVQAEPKHHTMSYATHYNPAATGEIKNRFTKRIAEAPLDVRKVIARRGACELSHDFRCNLGLGLPEAMAKVAREELLDDFVSFSTEAGAFGGVALSGHNFGAAENPDALLHMSTVFDAYNQGILDAAFLGAAEISEVGDVNVTLNRGDGKITGLGGFVDISSCTHRVFFLAQFTAGAKYSISATEGIKVTKEGHTKKFIKSVGKQISFPGQLALKRSQKVKYITERCVFELAPHRDTGEARLLLREIAPGIDLQRDILDQMEFAPMIPPAGPVLMGMNLYNPKPMCIRHMHFLPKMSSRLKYLESDRTLFVNLSFLTINDDGVIDALINALEVRMKKIGHKVNTVANYSHFLIEPEYVDYYSKRIKEFNDKWVISTRRFSSRAFRARQLSDALDIKPATAGGMSDLLASLQIRSPAASYLLENAEDPNRPLSGEAIEAIIKDAKHV